MRHESVDATLEMLKRTIDVASDAAFWMDDRARFVYVNRAACVSVGYTEEELLGMRLYDINPDSSPDGWAALLERIRVVKTVQLESRHRRKDGTVFPVDIASTYVTAEGREYINGFARDITARKQAEAELGSLERQLQHAQKLESLGILAGGIAHDFNNLLMAIQGYAEMAAEDSSDWSAVLASLEEIRRATGRGVDLTRQLLAYSGKGRFVVKRHDLSALVDEIGRLLRASIPRTIVWSRELAPDLPPVAIDAGQVQQVIMNLITNASDAIQETGRGEGTVVVRTGVQVFDQAYLDRSSLPEKPRAGRYVYLRVVDDGCGMGEDAKGRIFDPFYTTKRQGRGLGLAAALGIVRGHHGALVVESAVGHGSSFTVLFPCADGDGNETDTPRTNRQEPAVRGTGTVLVADDEETVLRLTKRMLERLGFDVLAARDGREAVDAFRAHAPRIVCVFLDLSMPVMGGDEALVQIRQLRPDTRVVLCTGHTEEHLALRHRGLVSAFLLKPYDLSALAHAALGPEIHVGHGRGDLQAAIHSGRSPGKPADE